MRSLKKRLLASLDTYAAGNWALPTMSRPTCESPCGSVMTAPLEVSGTHCESAGNDCADAGRVQARQATNETTATHAAAIERWIGMTPRSVPEWWRALATAHVRRERDLPRPP